MSTTDDARNARIAVEKQLAALKAKSNTRRTAYASHSRVKKSEARPMMMLGVASGTAAKDMVRRMFGGDAMARAQAIIAHGGQSARMQAALQDWAKNRDALLERRIAENRAKRARNGR